MTCLPLGRKCDECFLPFIKAIGRKCEPVHEYEGNTRETLAKLLFGSIFVFMLVSTARTLLAGQPLERLTCVCRESVGHGHAR
jgi:hypothetical protein